jgi:hypothetical protein
LEIESSDLEVTVSLPPLVSPISLTVSQSLWGEGMKSVRVPCSVSYWYAHALSAEESFLAHEEGVLRAIALLERTVQCLKTTGAVERNREGVPISGEMRRHATEQIRELRAFLDDSRKRTVSNSAVEREVEAQ